MNRRWTQEEIALVRSNPQLDSIVLAEKLGRSPSAINNLRSRDRIGRRGKEEEYDTRPSGWYVEIIGTLLLEYEDAFNTWKHYHRYIETKRLGAHKDGWTSLLCRRDADAP